MKLDLISYTPGVEPLIATAILTSTSGAKPSTLFHRLKKNQGKVRQVVERLEVQHGSILEHNRLNWVLEATEEDVLNILLDCRFFNATRLGEGSWLLSANLRTVIEYIGERKGAFVEALMESVRRTAPTLYGCLQRRQP